MDSLYLYDKPNRAPYHGRNLVIRPQNRCNNSRKVVQIEKYWFEPSRESQRSHPVCRASFGIHWRKALNLLKQIIRAVNTPEFLVNVRALHTSLPQLLIVFVNGRLPYQTNMRMTLSAVVLRGFRVSVRVSKRRRNSFRESHVIVDCWDV